MKFGSYFNHCGIGNPQDINLNIWISKQKYAIESTGGKNMDT